MDPASDFTRAAREEGWQNALPGLLSTQEELLEVARQHPEGLTAEEYHARLPHRSLHNLRSRLTELAARGVMEAVGRSPSARTGVRTTVWRVFSATGAVGSP